MEALFIAVPVDCSGEQRLKPDQRDFAGGSAMKSSSGWVESPSALRNIAARSFPAGVASHHILYRRTPDKPDR